MNEGVHCTPRAATEEANALPVGSTLRITGPAGHYLLTQSELDLIGNTVDIGGIGAGTTVMDAGGQSRVLELALGRLVCFMHSVYLIDVCDISRSTPCQTMCSSSTTIGPSQH